MDYYSQYSQPQPPPPLQPQPDPQYSYDASQSQTYDSYYGYYNHHQQYATPTTAVASASAYHQQNDTAAYDQYMQQYYSNYAPYQQPPVASQDSAPGTEPPQMLNSSAQIAHQTNVGDVPGSGTVPPALNPAAAAAVAALSQLSEFAESMEARERAMMQERQWQGQGGESVVVPLGGGTVKLQYGYPNQHQYSLPPQYGVSVHPEARRSKGRGQRGGRLLKGSGARGNIGRLPIGLNAESSHFQGRGHGGHMGKRGGGKRFGKHISERESPRTTTASQHSTAPTRQLLPPIAWCDICRVDCNTPEILEQHKNGKRHKKTVQKLEEIQARQKMLAENDAKESEDKIEGVQNQSSAMIESQTEVNKTEREQDQSSAMIEFQAEVTNQPEIMTTEENDFLEGGQDDLNDEPLFNRNASEPEKGHTDINERSEGGNVDVVVENSLTKVPAKRPRMDGNVRKFHKRKMMKFGRGSKMLRNSEPLPRMPKARHPNQESWICTLCNVVCDTQAILQCHFAGKKHTSKVKSYHGQEVTYQPQAYIAANQPPAYAPQYPVHFFQGPQPVVMAAHDGYATTNSEANQSAWPAGFGHEPSSGTYGVQANEGMENGNMNLGLKEVTYESLNVQSVATSTVSQGSALAP